MILRNLLESLDEFDRQLERHIAELISHDESIMEAAYQGTYAGDAYHSTIKVKSEGDSIKLTINVRGTGLEYLTHATAAAAHIDGDTPVESVEVHRCLQHQLRKALLQAQTKAIDNDDHENDNLISYLNHEMFRELFKCVTFKVIETLKDVNDRFLPNDEDDDEDDLRDWG